MSIKEILKNFHNLPNEQLEEQILKYIDEPIFHNCTEYINLFIRYFKLYPDIRLLYLMLHKKIGLYERFIYEEMAKVYRNYKDRIDISIAFLNLGIENRVFERNILRKKIEQLKIEEKENGPVDVQPKQFFEPLYLEFFGRIWFDYRKSKNTGMEGEIFTVESLSLKSKIKIGQREYFISEMRGDLYVLFVVYNETATINTDIFFIQTIGGLREYKKDIFIDHSTILLKESGEYAILFKESPLGPVSRALPILTDMNMAYYILYKILNILIYLNSEKIFLQIDLSHFIIVEDSQEDLTIQLCNFKICERANVNISDLLIKCKVEDISDFDKLYYIIKNKIPSRDDISQLVSNLKLEIYSAPE